LGTGSLEAPFCFLARGINPGVQLLFPHRDLASIRHHGAISPHVHPKLFGALAVEYSLGLLSRGHHSRVGLVIGIRRVLLPCTGVLASRVSPAWIRGRSSPLLSPSWPPLAPLLLVVLAPLVFGHRELSTSRLFNLLLLGAWDSGWRVGLLVSRMLNEAARALCLSAAVGWASGGTRPRCSRTTVEWSTLLLGSGLLL